MSKADSKHTPGPWACSENAYGAVFVHGGETLTSSVGTEYKELIAGGNSHDTLTLANARLISAAPEMLSALQTANQFLDHLKNSWEVCGHTQAMIDAVKAAIAKATGSIQ